MPPASSYIYLTKNKRVSLASLKSYSYSIKGLLICIVRKDTNYFKICDFNLKTGLLVTYWLFKNICFFAGLETIIKIMLYFDARIVLLFMSVGVALGATCPFKLNWNCEGTHLINAKFSGGIVSDCGRSYDKAKFEVFFRIEYELYDRSKKYTLVMVDPDAPRSDNGKGWLHMIKSGIDGGDLGPALPVNQNYSGTDVTPYGKPTPPNGTGEHRYFIFLYEEQEASPTGEIDQRQNFDVQEYATKNKLCGPVAMNMFSTKF
ncbi:phosphatidylethanolamine-binding protein 1-like [Palaemon carinicauda]|uniref:phosphatidylethanolamine-binding protein 1-like n=1 Tax=Palaemon carinicauda TaxID=392227 RepID=UPI0035B6411C